MTVPDRRMAGALPALVAALAEGRTFAEAATAAGMSERTARRRWTDSALRLPEQVDTARAEMFTATTAALGAGAMEAVTGLRTLAATSTSDAVRVRAYGLLLSEARTHRDLHDLERRMEALEARPPYSPAASDGRTAWHA